MMLGIKSVAAVILGLVLIAIGAARHAFDPGYLAHLSGSACFLIGLLASLAVALVGVGWRFDIRSRTALTRRGIRELARGTAVRELPAPAQRLVLLVGFACVLAGALGNHAAARITQLPAEFTAPSPSSYCLPRSARPAEPAPEPPPPAEPPGCALIKRAYQLGYAKSLGACAPRPAAAPVIAAAPREVCTRRQLDEPFLHYGARRVAGAAEVTAVDPVIAAERRVADLGAHIDFLDGLLADIRHAITGSPHAAHHLWIALPDPHPGSLGDAVVGAPRCAQRFADLPLWPAWRPADRALVVEHVLGQLLFATRFGTTASCNDYVIHWDAPADACARLAAAPARFLAGQGALASVRAVLDRRRRQIELAALAERRGIRPPAAPPPASAIVSLACLVVDPSGDGIATGRTVTLDGEALALRELRVREVRGAGDGPIDVYVALATLLAGRAVAPLRAAPPALPPGDDFPLIRADQLVDLDPFAGARAPLSRAELVEVYPFEAHLRGFVEAFRRRYLAQRGRL